MRNHDQKTRDMARSILPSTARHISRKRKKASHRRARARNNARLHRLMDHLDDLDEFEESLDRYGVDLDDTGWNEMVDDRRDADKIAPLIRWSEVHIERAPHLRDGDYWARRNHFRAILGDTLVGRHAMSHLDSLFGEENPWEYGRHPGWLSFYERAQIRREEALHAHERRARMLTEVLEGADARRLNKRIAALTPPVQEHWTLDPRGERVRCGQSGHEPWTFAGDHDRWLHVGTRGVECAQEIAFEALEQVHAEMFGLAC